MAVVIKIKKKRELLNIISISNNIENWKMFHKNAIKTPFESEKNSNYKDICDYFY